MTWFLDNALAIAGGITAFIVCWEAVQRLLKSGKSFFNQPSEEVRKEMTEALGKIDKKLDKNTEERLKNLIFKEKPNNMGIYIGNVSRFNQNKGHITLSLNENICTAPSNNIPNHYVKITKNTNTYSCRYNREQYNLTLLKLTGIASVS